MARVDGERRREVRQLEAGFGGFVADFWVGNANGGTVFADDAGEGLCVAFVGGFEECESLEVGSCWEGFEERAEVWVEDSSG